jgi:DNA-binding NtrC family response regulator
MTMAIENAGLTSRSLAPEPPPRFGGDGSYRDLMDVFAEYFCRHNPVHLKLLLDAIEKCLILKVLDKASGNQKEAAQILGVKYTTLNQKVKKYGIRFRRGVHLIEI